MSVKSIQKRFVAIRNNKFFELLVITIIVTSALLVGVKTYEISPGIQRLTRSPGRPEALHRPR